MSKDKRNEQQTPGSKTQQPHQPQDKHKGPEMGHEKKKSPPMDAEKKKENKARMDMDRQDAEGGQRGFEAREEKPHSGEKRR